MNIIKYPDRDTWTEILKRPALSDDVVNKVVLEILNDIKARGDRAVRDYTLKFDNVEVEQFAVTEEEFNEAEKFVESDLIKAILVAKENIEKFHSAQTVVRKVIETTPGVLCWQKSVPIEKVGLYIPGGTAPLFSTVLMLGIPARLAGCSDIILCTPPNHQGKVHPAILYTAKLTGVNRIFKIGGIQSVGAMTFGTETVPKVNKIFGPGNLYVTAAKQFAAMHGVAIDMPAGPSEVAIMADATCVPSFVAADLLSQAEHGADSQVILFTCCEEIIEPINKELNIQLEALPRKEIARKALLNSKAIILGTEEELLDITNDYAPEHLIIAMGNATLIAEKVINAGSVFIGNYSPESAGDYASGTNHALPTAGYAKGYNGVNLDSFTRKVTFQQLSPYGLFNIGPTIEIMAEAEELRAHRNAVSIRLKAIVNEHKNNNHV